MSSLRTELAPAVVPLEVIEGVETQLPCRPLDTSDAPWLESLSFPGTNINEAWLEDANALLATGSVDLGGGPLDTVEPVTRARQEFFGYLLGWNRPSHPLHEAYKSAQDDRTRITPLTTFIEAQRMLYKHDIDRVKLLKSRPDTIAYTAPVIENKISRLHDFGLDAAKIINAYPPFLAYSPVTVKEKCDNLIACGVTPKILLTYPQAMTPTAEKVRKRITNLERTAEMLGWEGDVRKLIEKFPAILGISSQKLYAHAWLFAIHGSPEMTEQEVKKLIIAPLEAHLLTIVEGRSYTAKNVDQLKNSTSSPERKKILSEMLLSDRRHIEALVGAKTVQAYVAYVQKRKTTTQPYAKIGPRR